MVDLFRRDKPRTSEPDDVAGDEAPMHRAPERPPLPKPERINRNVLTIVAVVMGTLVLAAVVFMQPSRMTPAERREQSAPPPAAPQGTFLDQPLAADTTVPRVLSDSAAQLTPDVPGDVFLGVDAARDPYTLAVPATPVVDPETEAYRAALESPLFAAQRQDVARMQPVVASDESLQESQDSATSAVSRVVASRYEEAPSPTPVRITAKASLHAAPGPFAVQSGTLIPAVLLTGIDSDLPGEVLAQVARDVYDSRTMQSLLIPQGSKLLGRYEDRVAVGQDRLLVAWSRVVFPDGRSLTLPGLETKDESGAGGLKDQVDHHTRQVFGTASLLSLIGAGVQLSQPRGALTPYGVDASFGQVAAGAVGRELADVATQMLRRNLDVQPTIRIRPGMPFNVFLNTDLTFEAPYDAWR